MHQYLLGHDYWSYIHGENEVVLESTHKDFLAWEQVASIVLYYLCILYARSDVESPSECKDAKGGMGKFEEDFRHEYHDP